MAASRKPGPLGSDYVPPNIDVGTVSTGRSAIPGPMRITPQLYSEYNANRVFSEALRRAVELTPEAAYRLTGLSLQGYLGNLIPGLLEALRIPTADHLSSDTELSRFSHAMPIPQSIAVEEAMTSLGLEFLPVPIRVGFEESDFVFLHKLAKLRLDSPERQTRRDYEIDQAAAELALALAVLLRIILRGVVLYLDNNEFTTPVQSRMARATLDAGKAVPDETFARFVARLRLSRLGDSLPELIRLHRADLLTNPWLRERLRSYSGNTTSPSESEGAPPSRSQYLLDDKDSPDDQPATSTAQSLTYIEILVIDEENNPVTKGKYRLELTDGSIRKGDLPSDGRIRVDPIPPGTCTFRIFQMIEFGTPDNEINRSWSWSHSDGTAFPVPNDFDHTGSEQLLSGESSA